MLGLLLLISAQAAPDWALRPLRRPDVPPGAASPIDAFLLARLKREGLAPAPPADRGVLLRRVTFDLTGLPPTPGEIAAFAADGDFDKVVERLLASPAYGERWARHWLDVAQYADTHGHDQDRPRPNAWPYRDYVIRALNEDKPWSRFVQEQIAGDVLFPDDPQATVALGFLAAGPWDESSQQEIVDDTVDKKIAQHLDRDQMLAATVTSFMGLTVECAQCHDHKFDPIPQMEYYRLQSIFAGVDRAERPFDADPTLHRERRRLGAGGPATDEERAAVAEWRRTASEDVWRPLKPVSWTASAVLEARDDGSLLSGGARPDTDVVTISVRTELTGLTAARLEVLTDDALPHRGPGRQDNGNLHLSEVKVQAVPVSRDIAARPATIARATADFDQAGWEAGKAVDGDVKTAWGIFPEVGKPHHAVFEFREPVGYEGGTILVFVLEQRHGGGHVIGRSRLSVTTSTDPLRACAWPAPVREALESGAEAPLVDFLRRRTILSAPSMVYAAAAQFSPLRNFRPAGAPRPVRFLKRGDVRSAEAEVAPGALSCIEGLPAAMEIADPASEGARRAGLARWVSDPRNGPTWRTIVNRVWQYHFGRGIADTPGDLGRNGGAPSHPELLDWLAVEFRDGGGSLKKLHRLIVTSEAYRRSSRHDPACAAKDGDNRLLWRMNRRALSAEEVRDAVLATAGTLDRAMGGPPVRHFAVKGERPNGSLDADYDAFDAEGPSRRAIYRFIFRTHPDPFMERLDCPDGGERTPRRTESVGPLQAMAMLNNRFVLRQSAKLAERGIPEALWWAWSRAPEEAEVALLESYAAKHGKAAACRLIFNSSEFFHVD